MTPPPISMATVTQILLVCPKCTRWRVFEGETKLAAQLAAKKKGWRMQGDAAVCPKCPAASYARR